MLVIACHGFVTLIRHQQRLRCNSTRKIHSNGYVLINIDINFDNMTVNVRRQTEKKQICTGIRNSIAIPKKKASDTDIVKTE